MPQYTDTQHCKTMTSKSAFNLDLTQDIEDLIGGESLPALQSNRYTGAISPVDEKYVDQDSDDFVKLGDDWYPKPALSMKDTDFLALPETVRTSLKAVKGTFKFSNGKSDLYVLPRSTRYVVLCRPIIHAMNKTTNVVMPIEGVDIGGDMVTVARLLVAILIGDNLVTDDNDNVQIFTIKIRSMNTAMVKDKKEPVTLYGLNNYLLKKLEQSKGWLLMLAATQIDLGVYNFVGKKGSSVGVKFLLPKQDPYDNALSLDNQKLITDLVKTESFKALSRDPFGLARRSAPVAAKNVAIPYNGDADSMSEIDEDDIPF